MLTIYLLFGMRFLYYKDYDGLKVKELHLDDIHSGDVFLLSYNNPMIIFVESLMGINFQHTAVAVKDKGQLYIIEYAGYKDIDKGVIKIPFSLWMKLNKNTYMLRNKIHFKNEEDEETLRREILKYFEITKTDKTLGGINPTWLRFMFPSNKYKGVNTNEEMICTEYTASVLIETGIALPSRGVEGFSPQDFIGLKGFNVNQKYSYTHDICDNSYILNFVD